MSTITESTVIESVIDDSRHIKTEVDGWSVRRIVFRYSDPEASDYDYENTRLRVPLYQRKWSWNSSRGREKMKDLIDSILHGYPIPAIILNYTVHDGNDFWDIYDGRHRIETVWKFVNNKFAVTYQERSLYFKDLHKNDRKHIMDFKFPTIITEDAPTEQLSEVFIRLNNGSPLKDKDLCWANRDKPLISTTINTLIENADRLCTIFGPKVNLSTEEAIRPQLNNWVGLINGLNHRSASMMTTSYLRLSKHLDDPIDQEAINEGLDLICRLYESANAKYQETNPISLQKHSKLGYVIAFFYSYAMYLPDTDTLRPVEEREDVIRKWTEVIGHIRSHENTQLLTTSGAQNLNHKKVSTVVRRVHEWFNGNTIDGVPTTFTGDM